MASRNKRNDDVSYPASSAWDKPGFLLWHATLEWQRQVTAALKDVDLTHVQFVLLAGAVWLEERTGPPSQRELADHAGTNPMMTSQVVRTLEKAELLERTIDPTDTRIKRLSATPQGAALARKAVALVEGVDRAAFADVDDLPLLLQSLRSVARRDPSGERLDDIAGA
ncbi:MAG: MarR family winged helix-turn-helix transcriptional regulator [Acidimicrobiales bacterium]